MYSEYFKPYIIYNIIFVITFSVSVNTFVNLQIINILFYIFFNLTLIYYIFYRYHYSIYFLALIYGVLFDIFLLNQIGSHLICFITLISLYIFFKNYLLLLSSYQVSLTIFSTLIFLIFSEFALAYLMNNIYFSWSDFFMFLIIALIIYIPYIFILNKIDK